MKGTLALKVRGMHCPACTALVQQEFFLVPGTVAVKIVLSEERAVIDWEAESAPDIRAYAERVEAFGYEVSEILDVPAAFPALRAAKPEDGRNKRHGERRGAGGNAERKGKRSGEHGAELGGDRGREPGSTGSWIASLIFATLFVGVYLAIGRLGLPDGIGSGIEGTVPAALIAGAAASVSTCLALVGSLVLALGTYAGKGVTGADDSSAGGVHAAGGTVPLRRNLAFQGGRIASFLVFGGALGALGATFSFSARSTGMTTVAAGLVALALGVGLVLPKLISLPALFSGTFTRRLGILATSGHPLAPALLGAATVLIPCGFALSMQALAVASGGIMQGSMIMGAFALGTAPVLIAVGLAGSWTRRKGPVLQRASGLVVVFLAMQSMTGGLAALVGPDSGKSPSIGGFSGETRIAAPSSIPAAATSDSTVQVVEMRVGPSSFSPSTIRVKAGRTVNWVVIGENPSGCTNRIIVPGTKISISVRKGSRQTVTFTPTGPGTVPFSCWMSMVHGKFIVE